MQRSKYDCVVSVSFAIACACTLQKTPSPEPTVMATENDEPADRGAPLSDEPSPELADSVESPVPPPSQEAPAHEPPSEPPAPIVPASAPVAERWLVDDDPRDPFGYICVYWGGGGPRCRAGILTPLASWRSRTRAHDGTSKPDHVLLVHRTTALDPQRFGLGEQTPIAGSHLTMYTFPSDGRVFVFIEVGPWLLEADSCQRHAKSVRNDTINLAKRIDAELSSGG